MNHHSKILFGALLMALGCGDDDDPASATNGDAATSDSGLTDAGTTSDVGTLDGAAGDAGNPPTDAAADTGTTPDAANPADGGGATGPKPIKVDCGSGVDATDCPVCSNPTTCDAPTYTDNGNGTVTSSCCGLVWQKVVEDVGRNWVQAHDYCAGLTVAGGGFRLPSIAELQTIVVGTTAPTINTTVFPNTPVDAFWSSSAGKFSGAWQVAFFSGASQGGALTNSERVRCVR